MILKNISRFSLIFRSCVHSARSSLAQRISDESTFDVVHPEKVKISPSYNYMSLGMHRIRQIRRSDVRISGYFIIFMFQKLQSLSSSSLNNNFSFFRREYKGTHPTGWHGAQLSGDGPAGHLSLPLRDCELFYDLYPLLSLSVIFSYRYHRRLLLPSLSLVTVIVP